MNFIKLLMSCLLLAAGSETYGQGGDASVSTRINVSHITVGDPAYVFLEVRHDPAKSTVQWAALPDSFSKLEIGERGKIDTSRAGTLTTYKQRLSVTGFDSGLFTIPSFAFIIIPKGGSAYTLHTDSLNLLVQTVAVDTTKAFRPIKDVIAVQLTWRDYMGWIVGGLIFLVVIIIVIIYLVFRARKKPAVKPIAPAEPFHQKALRLLDALESRQLWQKGEVKEYYVQLTDTLRNYIEAQFGTAAMELTTDELLDKVKVTNGLMPMAVPLERILRTADLAKFAKAQPLPQEHAESMELARMIITATIPAQQTLSTPAA